MLSVISYWLSLILRDRLVEVENDVRHGGRGGEFPGGKRGIRRRLADFQEGGRLFALLREIVAHPRQARREHARLVRRRVAPKHQAKTMAHASRVVCPAFPQHPRAELPGSL